MKRTAASQDMLYQRIRELVVAARQTVARGVDLVQVRTNFEIGRHIVEHEQQGEQRAAYGKAILKAMAEKLTQEFGSGFSETSLKTMRQFYMLYAERIGRTASDFSPAPVKGFHFFCMPAKAEKKVVEAVFHEPPKQPEPAKK